MTVADLKRYVNEVGERDTGIGGGGRDRGMGGRGGEKEWGRQEIQRGGERRGLTPWSTSDIILLPPWNTSDVTVLPPLNTSGMKK